jgi:AbrB family looped-hinge helix DNA binding protein
MLAELRSKSQITLPQSIVNKMGLSTGDKLEIFEKDGIICIMPVVMMPKKYAEEMAALAEAIDSETISNLKKSKLMREQGVPDYSIDEFRQNMRDAIAKGATNA